MAMQGFVELSGGITCHAWNKDMTALALCPNNHELHILEVENGALTEKHVYEQEHTQVITGIDWAPNSNQLVTCSHDRTCSVWTKGAEGWKPSMVVLKAFGRGATAVKWGPCETRFAVGSGAKQIQVCAYEAENDWWTGKPIREGIESTIFDIAFHPSSLILAAGGCDKTINVYSAIIKSLDSKASAKEVFGDGKPPKFGEVIFSVGTSGWVNGLAFSPAGNILCAAMHDSRMQFLNVQVGEGVACEEVARMRLRGLPVSKVAFLDEATCIGVGHDMVPLKFTSTGGEWKCQGSIDQGRAKKEKKKGAAAMWADKTDRGGAEVHEHNTTHENVISSLFVKPGSDGEFTTAGIDGRVVFWNTGGVAGSFAALELRK